MTTIVKIDGAAIGVDEFLRTLKLNGQFEKLVEQFVRDRLTVLAFVALLVAAIICAAFAVGYGIGKLLL